MAVSDRDSIDCTFRGGLPPDSVSSGAEKSLGRIDHYRILRELGGGGFGTVYLAEDTVSGVKVAVKGLPPLVKNNREELENIRTNFALVSRLTHENIAKALVLHPAREVEYSDERVKELLRIAPGDTMMVMDFAPGTTLSQWRRTFPGGIVPPAEAAEIVAQIASALDYAHRSRIIHRDIKPSNVMVDASGGGRPVARVLDFGLAAEIRSSMGRVSMQVTDVSGSRPYMAPEQWLGRRQGPATDQYALAALACELVSGEVPFKSAFDTGDNALMRDAVRDNEPEFDPGLPGNVRDALAKALSKNPADRFPSCAAFAAAFAGAPGAEGTPRPTPPVIHAVSGRAASPLAAVSVSASSSAASGASAAPGASKWPIAAVVAAFAVLAVAVSARFRPAIRDFFSPPPPKIIGGPVHEPPGTTVGNPGADEIASMVLKVAATEQKNRAAVAYDDARSRGFGKVPEFAKAWREFEISRRSGDDAFASGDYVSATNFYARVGVLMHGMSDAKQRLDSEAKRKAEADKRRAAEAAEKARAAEVESKIARGWLRRKGADGRDEAVWAEGARHPADETLFASARADEWLRRKKCPVCSGTGNVDVRNRCASCGGKGSTTARGVCTACSGAGSVSARNACPVCGGARKTFSTCEYCNGTRSMQCSACGGSGRVINPVGATLNILGGIGAIKNKGRGFVPPPAQNMMPCQNCGGSGRRQCAYCSGTGRRSSSCYACGGAGSVDGRAQCPSCRGSGKMDVQARCSTCAGSGNVAAKAKCTGCGGKGAVLRPAAAPPAGK